jgi:hypothetical protein
VPASSIGKCVIHRSELRAKSSKNLLAYYKWSEFLTIKINEQFFESFHFQLLDRKHHVTAIVSSDFKISDKNYNQILIKVGKKALNSRKFLLIIS